MLVKKQDINVKLHIYKEKNEKYTALLIFLSEFWNCGVFFSFCFSVFSEFSVMSIYCMFLIKMDYLHPRI